MWGQVSPRAVLRTHTVLASPDHPPHQTPSHTTQPPSLSLIRLPLHVHRSPTCSLPPRSARPARHGTAPGHRGALSCPSGCAQTKPMHRVLRGASSQAQTAHSGALNTHSRPCITLLLRTLTLRCPDCRQAYPCSPRTPTVQSHKAQGAPPGARGNSHFPAALGGRGWGCCSESQMLFLGSPNLPADSALGAVWQGVAKPQVITSRRLPGGASLGSGGEPTQDSVRAPEPPSLSFAPDGA